MSKHQRRLLYSRIIAYILLTLANTVILYGAWTLDKGDGIRIFVFAFIVSVMMLSSFAIWTIPLIEAYINERIEELLMEEDE